MAIFPKSVAADRSEKGVKIQKALLRRGWPKIGVFKGRFPWFWPLFGRFLQKSAKMAQIWAIFGAKNGPKLDPVGWPGHFWGQILAQMCAKIWPKIWAKFWLFGHFYLGVGLFGQKPVKWGHFTGFLGRFWANLTQKAGKMTGICPSKFGTEKKTLLWPDRFWPLKWG